MQRATVIAVLLALGVSFVPADCFACNGLVGASAAHKCCAPAHPEEHAGCCTPGAIAATVPTRLDHSGVPMSASASGQMPWPRQVLEIRSSGSSPSSISAPQRPQPPVVLRT